MNNKKLTDYFEDFKQIWKKYKFVLIGIVTVLILVIVKSQIDAKNKFIEDSDNHFESLKTDLEKIDGVKTVNEMENNIWGLNHVLRLTTASEDGVGIYVLDAESSENAKKLNELINGCEIDSYLEENLKLTSNNLSLFNIDISSFSFNRTCTLGEHILLTSSTSCTDELFKKIKNTLDEYKDITFYTKDEEVVISEKASESKFCKLYYSTLDDLADSIDSALEDSQSTLTTLENSEVTKDNYIDTYSNCVSNITDLEKVNKVDRYKGKFDGDISKLNSKMEECKKFAEDFNNETVALLDAANASHSNDDLAKAKEKIDSIDISTATIFTDYKEEWNTYYSTIKTDIENAEKAAKEAKENELKQATKEKQNALKSAKSYIKFMNFSRSGLIQQLEYEGYSTDAATWAVDYMDVDWNEQAAGTAQNYLDTMSFSRSGLIEQLEFEGFTAEQAEYGVTAVGY